MENPHPEYTSPSDGENCLAKCWIQGMNQYLEYTGSYEVIDFPIKNLSVIRKILERMPIVQDDLDCYPCIGLDGVFWIRRLNTSLFFCEISKKYGDINYILNVIQESLQTN